jgi:hypothetical protein
LDGGLASDTYSIWKNKFVDDMNNTVAGHDIHNSPLNHESTIIDANFNSLSIDGFG